MYLHVLLAMAFLALGHSSQAEEESPPTKQPISVQGSDSEALGSHDTTSISKKPIRVLGSDSEAFGSYDATSKKKVRDRGLDSEAFGSYDATSVFTPDDEGPIGHNFREGEYSYNYYTQNSKIVGTGHITDDGEVKIFDNSESNKLNSEYSAQNLEQFGLNTGSSDSEGQNNYGSGHLSDNSGQNQFGLGLTSTQYGLGHTSSQNNLYSGQTQYGFGQIGHNTAQIQGTQGTDGEYTYGANIGHTNPKGQGGTSFVYVTQSGHQNSGETYYPEGHSVEEHVLGDTDADKGQTDSEFNTNIDLTNTENAGNNYKGQNTLGYNSNNDQGSQDGSYKGPNTVGYNTNIDLTNSNVKEGTYIVTDHGDEVKNIGDVKQALGNSGGSVSYIFVSQGVSENQDVINHAGSGSQASETSGEDETERSSRKPTHFGAASYSQGSPSISRVHTAAVADFGLTVDSEVQNMGQIFGQQHGSPNLGLQSGVRDGNQGHFYGGHINHGHTGQKAGSLTDKHLFGGGDLKVAGHLSEEGGNFGLQMPGSIEMEGHPDAGHSYGGNQVIHHSTGDGESSFGIGHQRGHEDKHLFENQGTTEENGGGFHANEEFNENNGASFNDDEHQNNGFEEYGNNNQFKGPSFGHQSGGHQSGGSFHQNSNFNNNKGNSPLYPLNFNNRPGFGSQPQQNQFKGNQNFGHQNVPNLAQSNKNRKPNFAGFNSKPNLGQNFYTKPAFGQNGGNFGHVAQNNRPSYGQNAGKPHFGTQNPDLRPHLEGEVGGTGNLFKNQNIPQYGNFGSYGQKIKPIAASNLFNQNQFGQNQNRAPAAQKPKIFNKIRHHNKEVSVRHQTKVQGISNAVLFGGQSRSTQRSHDLKPHMWAGHMMNENFKFGIQKNNQGHYVGLPENKYVNNYNFDKVQSGGQYDSRSKYAEGPEMNDGPGKSYDVKEPNSDNMKFVNMPFAKQVSYPSAGKGKVNLPQTIYKKMSKDFDATFSPGSKTIQLPVYTKKIRQIGS